MGIQGFALIFLGLYLIVMLGIGIYGRKHAESFSDFIDTGKKATLIMLLGTALGNHIGGGFVIGGSEYGAQHGIGGGWFGMANGIAYLFFALIAKKIRLMNAATISDALVNRYGGKRPGIVFALLNTIGYTGIIASQIFIGGNILSALGMDPTLGVIVTTLIVIAYASFSGLWGAMMTDIVQVIACSIGLGIALIYLLTTYGTVPFAQLEPSNFNFMPFNAMEFLMIIVPTSLFGFLSQVTYQRTAAAENDKIAVSHHWISGLILLPLAFVPVIIGMYGKAFMPDVQPAQALIMVMLNSIPPVIGAMLIVSIFAALMSTSDGLILGVIAHILHDIYKHVPGANTSDQNLRKGATILTISVGVGALLIALMADGIVSTLILAYSVVVCGSVVALLGGLIWEGATEAGAFWSMIIGGGTFLLARFGILPIPYPNLTALIPSVIIFIVVSLITSPKEDIESEY